MAREDKMIQIQKERSRQKINEIKKIVDQMVEEKSIITPYTVWKKAGVSKSFIYKPEVKQYIEKYRNRMRKHTNV